MLINRENKYDEYSMEKAMIFLIATAQLVLYPFAFLIILVSAFSFFPNISEETLIIENLLSGNKKFLA